MNGSYRNSARRLLAASSCVLLATCYHPPHERTPEWDLANGEKRPHRLTAQQEFADALPLSPDRFSPDPSLNPEPEPAWPVFEFKKETIIDKRPLLSPTRFNPDPGKGMEASATEEDSAGIDKLVLRTPGGGRFFEDGSDSNDNQFFSRDAGAPKKLRKYRPEIPADLQLPRQGLEHRQLDVELVQGAGYGSI